MIIFITANSFLVFPKLSKAKKSWQLSSECSCNTMIAVQGLFVSVCTASLLNSRVDEFFVEIIYFPCCFQRRPRRRNDFLPPLLFCIHKCGHVQYKNDPNKCTTIIIRELVKPM